MAKTMEVKTTNGMVALPLEAERVKTTLLWQNGNADNVGFDDQLVTLSENATNFKYLIIVYSNARKAGQLLNARKYTNIINGNISNINFVDDDGTMWCRNFDITNSGTKIHFYTCLDRGATVANSPNRCIPYEIYGANSL